MSSKVKWLFFWFLWMLTAQSNRLKAQTLPLEMVADTLQLLDSNRNVIKYSRAGFRFWDSVAKDSGSGRFKSALNWQTPSDKVGRVYEPYSPFIHETYLRISRVKFWFFGVSIFIILYYLYFRAAFAKQFQLRMSSFTKQYYFEDLMREQAISSAAGSIHAFNLGLLVFCQGILLYLVAADYNRLNSIYTFILAIIVTGIFNGLLLFAQYIFTQSMDMGGVLLRQFQRQINVNLLFGLICMPVFLLSYYNADYSNNSLWLKIIYSSLIIWISIRLLYQVYGLIKDNTLNFTSILYLCTLEIIPYLLLLKFLGINIS
ncbi:MAG: DUF4271 domain-containing protein [Bacteroidia bacterium]|nr:DUF4271 domain-containing protein [Bacteroidia bacterium]